MDERTRRRTKVESRRWRSDCQWDLQPHDEGRIRKRPIACRMGLSHGGQRRRSGAREQRSLPRRALRNSGARLLQQQDLFQRTSRRFLWQLSAAGESLPQARRVADLRHYFSPAQSFGRWQGRKWFADRLAQWNPDSGPYAGERAGNDRRKIAGRGAKRATHITGPWQPGPLSQYLDQTARERPGIKPRGLSIC